MIEYRTGDIFAEDVEDLFDSVNCVAVMGRGIALRFKRAFPENFPQDFKAYAGACGRKAAPEKLAEELDGVKAVA